MSQKLSSSCTYSEVLDCYLEKYPEKTNADPQIDISLTYKRFQEVSRNVSRKIEHDILSPKEIVHIIGGNSLALYVCYYAVVFNDWVPVGSNPRTARYLLQKRIDNTYSKVLLISHDVFEMVMEKLNDKKLKLVFTYEVVNRDSPEKFNIEIREFCYRKKDSDFDTEQLKDTSFILMTSGITMFPKAVMINHNSILDQLNYLRSLYNSSMLNPQRTFIMCNHFSHSGGMLTFFMGIFSGHNIVIMDGFDPKYYLETFRKYECNYLLCTPVMLTIMSKYPDLSNYNLSNTLTIVCGGDKINMNAIKEVKEKTKIKNSVEFFQAYDSCECPITHFTQSHIDSIKNYLEPAAPPIQFKIINEQTNFECTNNEVGKLLIKSPSTMIGYLNDQEKTKSVIDNEWYNTGDTAHFDQDRNIHLSARVSEDVPRFKEFKVSYEKLEHLFLQHPAVKIAGVYGIQVEEDGFELAVAVLETCGDINTNDVKNFVNQRIDDSSEKIDYIYIRGKIPITDSNKVDRSYLKDIITGQVPSERRLWNNIPSCLSKC